MTQVAMILHPREEPGRSRETLLWCPQREIASGLQPKRLLLHLHDNAAPPLPLNETDGAEAQARKALVLAIDAVTALS